VQKFPRYMFVLLTIIAPLIFAIVLFVQDKSKDDIWRFNFAPQAAPNVKSFVKISGKSLYSKKPGYGWINTKGLIKTGRWHSEAEETWEACQNLNVVCRRGPDDLARSYAAGPATFALDLKPGKYEVWVLSGDWGYLEYIPYEPYKIMIENAAAYDFKMTEVEFYKRFETPDLEDDLTELGVWQRYVKPRFKWSRAVVDVMDGQLNVNVIGGRRNMSILDFVGDYANTETRKGPNPRFTGALNAMIVMLAKQDSINGFQIIDKIDKLRRHNFNKRWPLEKSKPEKNVRFTKADQERGYTIFFTSTLEPVVPNERRMHAKETIQLQVTPGEYVPITFGICPLKDLGETRISFDRLQRLSGDYKLIVNTFGQLKTGVVRYVAGLTDKERKTWRPTPFMIVPTDTWSIHNGVTKQFWLTYHVPDEMIPGLYKGEIHIIPEKAEETKIRVELEVLPFKLERPTHLAVGMTYFSPVQYSYFGEERFWKRMEAEFADMRAHNMTCIQYTGIHMDDYERIDTAFKLYRKAGFEHPVYLLESYGAMWRLRRNGISWETEEFHTKYVQFIREFLKEAKFRQWPPIIINFGDEFTNQAMEEFGAKLARNLKKIPGIVTGADTDGYKEVALMAPVVDIVAFDNGWDGPNGVNRGKKLLKKETVDLVKKAGATPWLVNVAKDRFSNGFWLWKMARFGVRGKMEWMYRGYNGMPFNSFDAYPMRGHIVYPGPNGTAIPSLNYEWMRMGLDDLAYLYTLEQVIDATRKDTAKKAAITKADAFIKKIDGMIEDDMNKYRDSHTKNKYTWPAERYDEIRSEIIDLILQLYKK
jgi:Glycoside hydrolase 123, catalytic domain